MDELKGIEYLRNKLSSKKSWVERKYKCYEMKGQLPDPSPVIPRDLS